MFCKCFAGPGNIVVSNISLLSNSVIVFCKCFAGPGNIVVSNISLLSNSVIVFCNRFAGPGNIVVSNISLLPKLYHGVCIVSTVGSAHVPSHVFF